jgi:glutamine amidotransferase
MMITIIDYNAGNLTSVRRALEYLGLPCRISADPEQVLTSERVIFPGVGHAASAMQVLRRGGLDEALRTVYTRGTPILGICLGAQIILSHSDEGDTPCLGLIEGNCPRFSLTDPTLKIPHMGWNAVQVTQPHFILKDLCPSDEFYFVHSYYPQPVDTQHVFAAVEYENYFPAAIGCRNLFAVQFHPEKSGEAGLSLLRNFASWDGYSQSERKPSC